LRAGAGRDEGAAKLHRRHDFGQIVLVEHIRAKGRQAPFLPEIPARTSKIP
jgi:hypothetical protein